MDVAQPWQPRIRIVQGAGADVLVREQRPLRGEGARLAKVLLGRDDGEVDDDAVDSSRPRLWPDPLTPGHDHEVDVA